MVAYKPLQAASAFRTYCRGLDMDINEYDPVAKDLESYEDDPQWKDLIKKSKSFIGVVDSVSPSPCSVLLYDKSISEELGLLKVGDVICCCIDGYNSDVFKYVKNDYLRVQVWGLISKTYELLGEPIDDISSLMKKIDKDVWDLLGSGLTTTINQCDSDYDKQVLKQYKPKTLEELSMYVAAIRPGFKSMLQNFIERKPYSTGVKELDDLLQDSYHYLAYQENIMTYLHWLGIPEKDTYDTLKKISKKKFTKEEQKNLEDRLKLSWMDKVGNLNDFQRSWQAVQDAAQYVFNASHSLSVALDALYGAYLKAKHPLEYFTVALSEYAGDEIRTNNLIEELKYFKIKLMPPKFRHSRASYTLEAETRTIHKGIESIKYLNSAIAEELYALKDNQYEDFLDFLFALEDTSMNKTKLDILTKIDFFSEFGNINYLLKIIDMYRLFKARKTLSASKLSEYEQELGIPENTLYRAILSLVDGIKPDAKVFKGFSMKDLMKKILPYFKGIKTSIQDRITYEFETLGYCDIVDPNADKHHFYVAKVEGKKKKTAYLYELHSGLTREVIGWDSTFRCGDRPIAAGDLIEIKTLKKSAKTKPTNEVNPKTGKKVWVSDPSLGYDYWLGKWFFID